MYNQDTARIKAAMVIHALEQDLGEYVRCEHTDIPSDNVANDVMARIKEKDRKAAVITSNLIIEATYIAEILNLAVTASSNTSDEEYFIRLKRIFESLELSEIRNAVSHPNRQFPETYWHRVAAFATDPVIDKIKFTRLIQKYNLASEERISSPPDEWMNLRRSYIRNNLPDSVEHELTGLIGRDRDLSKLENELKKGRHSLIALVARGGTGKTALALECLNRLVLVPETADWAEAIVYCTLKQERLTLSGVQKISAPNTIGALRSELLASINYVLLEECIDLEALIAKHAKTKLLVAIDNLETLLRDKPEEFGELIDQFPRDWKVLVTSRLPVEAAKNTPLESLSRQSSLFLTRKYFLGRGYSNVDADTLERIGTASNDNPLAIRLIADLYIAGKDVNSAITVAANEITSFSFLNLIEALSDDSILVLEGLFALGSASRPILLETLEISLDRVASAVAQLGKTSLLTRTTNDSLEEIYGIDESIRDLLRVAPKNLDIRRQVSSNISRLRAIENNIATNQSVQKKNILDRDYIPADAPIVLIPLIDKLNIALIGKNSLIVKDIDTKLRALEEVYQNSPIFHRQIVRIGFFFGDQVSQESALLRILQISPSDPYAILSLGYLYRSQQKLEESLTLFEKLLAEGWGEIQNAGQIAAVSIHQGYVSTLIFMGRYKEVIEATSDWKARGCLRLVYGVARASAFRHLSEPTVTQDKAKARIQMEFATNVLSSLVSLEGLPTPITREQFKVVDNTPSILGNIEDTAQDRQTTAKLLNYCFEQMHQLQGQLKGQEESIIRRFQQVVFDGNPFSIESSKKNTPSDLCINEPTSIPTDFQRVKIYYIPSAASFPSFMFAEDDHGKTYFLQAEKFQKGDWANWILLKIGSTVAVQSVPSISGSTDFRATKILAL